MTLDLARIQALCFDVDGTLSDTDDLWVSRMEKMLAPLHLFMPRRGVRPLARWLVMGLESPGNMFYTSLDRLHLDDEVGRLFNFFARRKAHHKSNFLMVPQVDQMLVGLSRRFPLAVVSARDHASTQAFLEHVGVRLLFKAVATSQTCAYTKPFPDPVVWAAQQMGVQPYNCLMVGDTVMDIRAGKSAGAQTVGVLCGFGTEKELLRAGADLILESTAHLADILVP
jgi:N-acetyl-D-muramate 6-phosphate phosphatase